MRRRPLLLGTLLAACLVAAPAQAGTGGSPLAARLAEALSVPHVARSKTAAIVLDLETGETVFSQNAGRSLAPASNEKLLVTYAALEALGAGYTIETDVLGEGQLDGTTWRGFLVLQGHGDPTLSLAKLNGLARQVRAAGIRRIAGGIVGDESFFDSLRTAAGWKPSFYLGESPPLSALSVDRGWFGWHTSPAPALAAATEFASALSRAGVSVSGGVTRGRADPDAFLLGSVQSPPLSVLLRFMDHESDNFTAELLLKQLAAVDDGVGTSAGGAALVTATLAGDGIPLAGVRIVDGSGLSLLDRLTTRTISSLLKAAWANPELRGPFLAALAVAGVNGTLEHRLQQRPAYGQVRAKTGTTAGASALSGFVRGRYVFSILQNGHPLAVSWAQRAQDRFATLLAAQ